MSESIDYPTAIVSGKTEINHNRRVRMNMGLLHFCVMDHMLALEKKGKPVSEVELWTAIGIKSRQFAKAAKWLIDEGYLSVCAIGAVPASTGKHRNVINGSKSIDDMFDEFWKPLIVEGESYRFTGSKDAARNVFKYAIDDVGFEYLMEQKLWYFRMINETDFRNVMMGATFLSRRDKRYKEDFKSECKKKLYAVLPDSKTPSFNKEQFNDMFKEVQ